MSIVASLLASVRRCLNDLPDLERGLVVAVSGGADSIALLRLLVLARPPGTPLVLAHLNHLLRGLAGDSDEAFVGELHAQLSASGIDGLTVRTQRKDVAAFARRAGENLEAAARQVRYDWLTEVARTAGMRWVATGHTANDQAETVLHRMLRGTGLQGLRGIAARRPLAEDIEVVRPLLHLTRSQVIACLKELGQSWREDATNADPRFTRNRIRLELLPHLAEHYNPAIVSVLARLADQANESAQIEEQVARELLQAVELPRAGSLIVLDADRLALAARQHIRALFRLLWMREGWPRNKMTFATWDRLADLIGRGPAGLDLPGGIHARRAGRIVQLRGPGITHRGESMPDGTPGSYPGSD